MRHTILLLTMLLAASQVLAAKDKEKVFSGPQVGEKITGFKVAGVYDALAGKQFDPIEKAGDNPVLLIFFNQLSRPAGALVRSLDAYAHTRQKDKLQMAIVFLSDDRSKTEQFLTRARKALGFKTPVGISVDGPEGPGNYGLNRNVALTFVLASKKKVVANFALVQPSVTDAPQIAKAITDLIGGKAPSAAQLEKLAYPDRKMSRANPPAKRGATNTKGNTKNNTRGNTKGNARANTAQFGPLHNVIRAIINKQATPKQIKEATETIEKLVAENESYKPEVLRIARVAIDRQYGTETARRQMQRFIDQYSDSKSKRAPRKDPGSPKPDADTKSDADQTESPKVYSGPQPGEKIAGFEVIGVYDDQAGKKMDWVKKADGKPLLLIFVHKLTRPGAALIRSISAYGHSRSKAKPDGLQTYIVWLTDDRSKAEQYLNIARKSLNLLVPIGICADGQEGPGSYGLNRNVELTILVAKENKVIANFAWVQPSVTDAPKVGAALAGLLGGEKPTLEQMTKLAYPGGAYMRKPRPRRTDPAKKTPPKTRSKDTTKTKAPASPRTPAPAKTPDQPKPEPKPEPKPDSK